MADSSAQKQNVAISISPDTVRKARMSGCTARNFDQPRLVAEQIEILVATEEAWERSERSALALLEQGFHLGGRITASRAELHER